MRLPAIFNPSNDMSLAANLRQYTPPRHIQQMENDLASLARFWDEGPWGWSMAMKQRYRKMDIAESDLPTDEWLAKVRQLSSREFGVAYYEECYRNYRKHSIYSHYGNNNKYYRLLPCRARYCTTFGTVQSSIGHFPSFIAKAPWSSSGRGNIVVRGKPDETTMQRIAHIIQKQGGIVVEPFYPNKALDFAMEFDVSDEGVEFMGYSVFSADETGHYSGNYVESQEALLRRIALPQSLLDSLIAYHKGALSRLPYRGPVGIDMMRLADGRVHPCVEVNFRMTMGLLAILLYRKGIKDDQFLTPKREQGFMCAIQQGRLCILVSKEQNGQQPEA